MMIRDLTQADIPTLVGWLRDFNEDFDYPGKRPIDDECAALFFGRFVDSASQAAIILERDGRPIATLGFSILPHPWNGAKIAFKAFWYAEKSAPGAGVALLRYFRDACKAGGVEQLIFSSMHLRVNKLLEREGFRPCELNYVLDFNGN